MSDLKQPDPNVEVWQCPDCGLETTTAHALYECIERLREQLKQKDERIGELEQERDWEQAGKEVADRQVSKLKERIAELEAELHEARRKRKQAEWIARRTLSESGAVLPDMPGE